ncbi:MAG: bifunctional metallophosphatase/5'-nucleotidase [Anaerolineales bacterium]|nr:MAG: bifunctional metallophosphatase/5'-nucleotidase [Anaerolineales bacterium]
MPISKSKRVFLSLLVVIALALPLVPVASAQGPVNITILHTNDFHGNLQVDYAARGGAANLAGYADVVKAEVGADNVILLDAGDNMQGQPISNLLDGASVIDVWNMMGYKAAAVGNHEFDWGQDTLAARVAQSNFPWLGANIVVAGTSDHPDWVTPWTVVDVAGVKLGIIGLGYTETPGITRKGLTDGLEFQDPVAAVLRYYDEVKAQSDALILLTHIGWDDRSEHKGGQTIATELAAAGKPVDLIIGGHSHEEATAPHMAGDTPVVIAYQYGRWMGRADVTVDPAAKKLTLVNWEGHAINDGEVTPHVEVAAKVAEYAAEVEPLTEVVVGSSTASLVRDYNAESNMGNIVTDAMRDYTKADVAFTNAGGLREDILLAEGETEHNITWGETYAVMPFANTLFNMDLTGAQIMEILNQSATFHKGIIQSSGITWSYYNDCSCNEPTVWGAVNVQVGGEPLQLDKAYRVTTNDFLAPGGDEWVTFAEGTNRENTYVDMQEVVNDYIGGRSPIAPAVEGRITQVEVPAELPATGGIPMPMPIVLTAVGFALAGTGLLVRQKRGQAA